MSKRSTRLVFTDEERAAPKPEETKRRAEKAGGPQKAAKAKRGIIDEKTGRVTAKLHFEETEKKRPPSKLAHEVAAIPCNTIAAAAHRQVRETEDDNVGVESAHKLEGAAESGLRAAESAHRSHRLKYHRNADRAETASVKEKPKARHKASGTQNPQFQSNPYSRWQQKQAIKKDYAAAKTGKTANRTVKATKNTAKSAKKTAEGTKKTGEFIARHRKGFLIGGGILAALVLFLNLMSSCSVFFQAGLTAVGASTYPSVDDDMRAAEQQYCAMEAELRNYLNIYESTHGYDEYYYDLDTIEHDPYVLISAITALHGGAWTIDEVGDILDLLFEKQYILTETVNSEIRYRTETRTDYVTYTDPDTGETFIIPYEYEVQVPYTYYICTVELENFNLSHVPVYIMTEEQLSMYATYMGALGNRPDLFGYSPYVDLYYNTEYEAYEIPPEALEDERFAAMIKEAEKYLGYPYIWGGSSPSTSFDCSGFVSWVLNNCGAGWNVGRLGCESLRRCCTAVSAANAKPGDLVFFYGTYDTTGASHVGIYVGDGMMIHCGDPIQYTSISTDYWQAHFLSFGRLPSP